MPASRAPTRQPKRAPAKAATKALPPPQKAPVLALSAFMQLQPQAIAHLTQALVGERQAHAFFLVGAQASHAPQVARALVASLVCAERSGRDACTRCSSCRRWHGGHHPNVHLLVPEGAGAIGIAAVRALRHKLALVGHDGAATVVLVAEAAKLATASQQALLKTLEEPPGPTTFVFVAEHMGALLPTLRSRMSVLLLGQRDERRAIERLRAGGIEPRLAALAAMHVGDDVAAAEALVDAGLSQVIERLEGALGAGQDIGKLSRAAQELGADKVCFELALTGLSLHVRDALLGRLGGEISLQRSLKSRALVGHVATNQLCATADALNNLVRRQVPNLNRALALEGLFLLLNQSAITP